MTEWMDRPQEERALLNPAFCTILLWHAALERSATKRLLSFEECFLVLPFVLPTRTRELLPSTAATSMTTWLEDNPLEQRRLVARSRLMVPFTRTALLFGTANKAFQIKDGNLLAEASWNSKVVRFGKESSAEVRSCIQKSKLISKWLLKSGTPSTVFALLGVRP
jgi:hypothetical protein